MKCLLLLTEVKGEEIKTDLVLRCCNIYSPSLEVLLLIERIQVTTVSQCQDAGWPSSTLFLCYQQKVNDGWKRFLWLRLEETFDLFAACPPGLPAAKTSPPPAIFRHVLNRLHMHKRHATAWVKWRAFISNPIHDRAASARLIQPPETWIPGLNSRVQPDGWLQSGILTCLINLSWQTFFFFISFFFFSF